VNCCLIPFWPLLCLVLIFIFRLLLPSTPNIFLFNPPTYRLSIDNYMIFDWIILPNWLIPEWVFPRVISTDQQHRNQPKTLTISQVLAMISKWEWQPHDFFIFCWGLKNVRVVRWLRVLLWFLSFVSLCRIKAIHRWDRVGWLRPQLWILRSLLYKSSIFCKIIGIYYLEINYFKNKCLILQRTCHKQHRETAWKA